MSWGLFFGFLVHLVITGLIAGAGVAVYLYGAKDLFSPTFRNTLRFVVGSILGLVIMGIALLMTHAAINKGVLFEVWHMMLQCLLGLSLLIPIALKLDIQRLWCADDWPKRGES